MPLTSELNGVNVYSQLILVCYLMGGNYNHKRVGVQCEYALFIRQRQKKLHCGWINKQTKKFEPWKTQKKARKK